MKIAALPILTALSFGITTMSAADSAGFQADRYLGYWHDGSGVVRDATPVTTWQDFAYKTVEKKDKRGKPTKVAEPDRTTGDQSENIVWQVPHYNYCNGGLIMVQGKLLGLSDRGGLGFNMHREADFTGALLTCFDPATGKELWKVDLHHWDLVPNGDELLTELKDYNRTHPARFLAYYRLTLALGYKKSSNLTQEKYEPLRDAFNAVADNPAPETVEEAYKSPLFISHYLQTSYAGKVGPKYFPTTVAKRERLKREAGYLKDPWFGLLEHLGLNMQTPVSDGEHIYVATAFGAVFCVDLNGKVVWKHWFGAGWERGWAIPSPVLVGDSLIVAGYEPSDDKGKGTPVRVAMDKNDGTVRWSTDQITSSGYQAAPAVLSLPVAGNDADRMDVLFYGDGDVVRAEDGKRIARSIAGGAHARPWAVDGTRIAQVNATADGGSYKTKTHFQQHQKKLIVFELAAPSRDEATATLLWTNKDCSSYANGIILNEGKLYWSNRGKSFHVMDGKTGKEIAKCGGPRPKVGTGIMRPMQTPYIAGRYYFGMYKDGTVGVIDLGDDGVSPKPVVLNRLAIPTDPYMNKLFNYGAQMLISGNRIFTRSNEVLYCIGDPDVEMVLSEVHR